MPWVVTILNVKFFPDAFLNALLEYSIVNLALLRHSTTITICVFCHEKSCITNPKQTSVFMVMVKCMKKWRDSSLLKLCSVIETLFNDKIHLIKIYQI